MAGLFSNLPSKFSGKTKKFNPFYVVFLPLLCASFYLIGVFQHGAMSGSSGVSNSYAVAGSGCLTNATVNTNVARPDFQSHHSAESTIKTLNDPNSSGPTRIPSCDPKLFEYTPCEDAERSLKFDRNMLIYRERHCPTPDEAMRCRIPAPFGYRVPVRWPESRNSVWYANVPHKWLTVEKAVQNWVRYMGERFVFPGGGTMFPNGADAYINDIGKLINLKNGSVRTAIDTGCGVASFGGYLMSRDILTVSVAPKDSHEAQIQFALERGIPALLGLLSTHRLPFPSASFDLAHCSRCLIPWGSYDGMYLIEVDRILRPGAYWVLSGPPINWEQHYKGWERTKEDLSAEQDGIEKVARSLCWKKLKQKGDLAIWQKPTNHVHCQRNRKVFKQPQFCPKQDPDRAWYTKMEKCLTPLPEVSDLKEVAGGELARWPQRLTKVPPRIKRGRWDGVTEESFVTNTDLWKKRVAYYKRLDYQFAERGRYRNLLDMNAYLGGFAAALINHPVWVMNVVPVEAKVNTLGAIYDRGLIGTYQNWCQAMSTYPRTYDFIHADSVFTLYNDRCEMEDILLEMDRVLRPEGSVIIRDDVDMVVKIKAIIDGMEWESRIVDHENGPLEREKLLVAKKQYWTAPPPPRPRPRPQPRHHQKPNTAQSGSTTAPASS